jgi:isoamylase
MELQKYIGFPFPLGATWDGEGVNFSIFSDNATSVEVCLFDHMDDREPTTCVKMTDRTYSVWHVYIPGIKPCQLYGFRVYGPYNPEEGMRFNPNKLLIDPNAKAISGTIKWHDSLFGYDLKSKEKDLTMSKADSAPYIPKCIVVANDFDWEDDKPLNIPYQNTIIYEAHVKGFTQLNKDIPENIRGTYAAISHPASIKYLQDLGITAIELMPVHHFVTDRHLFENGLTNYWGYNTINYFSPDIRYSSSPKCGGQINEFKQMVKELHRAGIEVILDVVYNHTAEGNELGPTLSLRGIDNASYYRLTEDKRHYMDYTGTGNTLNTQQPNVLRMIMDSLRYWILDMHVDGFRFDLASTLARELHEVDRLGSFFDIIHQDPVISQVKLIAEPWDVGEGGYQVGKFPPGWAEWNGMYRDCIRDYWRGADSMLAEFAGRFTGSADLYKDDRYPSASINFVTAHDGFTMRDLVSYNEKHNEANGENNNDGESYNRSWNCGAEGETDDKEIIALRKQQVRNFMATLFLSQGVPMLVAGDEIGRTQKGNNNAYCQDNEISWLDWNNMDHELLAFVKRLIQLRKEHPIFCRTRWFKGEKLKGGAVEDIAWFLPEGTQMTDENWNHDFAKSLAVFMNGKAINAHTFEYKPITDDNFYIIFNAHFDPLKFVFPGVEYGDLWIKIIDTAHIEEMDKGLTYKCGTDITVEGRSVIVLQHKNRN